MTAPVHEHDCDRCIFLASYPLKHPYTDTQGYRTGVVGRRVTMGDIYLSCDNSGYKYIVRYGIYGEYATTNVVTRYVKAPLIDGMDQYFN